MYGIGVHGPARHDLAPRPDRRQHRWPRAPAPGGAPAGGARIQRRRCRHCVRVAEAEIAADPDALQRRRVAEHDTSVGGARRRLVRQPAARLLLLLLPGSGRSLILCAALRYGDLHAAIGRLWRLRAHRPAGHNGHR